MLFTPAAAASSQDVTLPFIAELYNPKFLDVLLPIKNDVSVERSAASSSEQTSPKNPMMEALKSTAHHTLTENMSPAYSSTGSPTLDAFQHLVRNASGYTIDDALRKAWNEDPALTVRIIWNSRSIHDGKGEKELFYQAYGWLYRNHPRTAIYNLPWLVAPVCKHLGKESQEGGAHGYWKDVLNILGLATFDELGPLESPDSATFLHPPRVTSSRTRRVRRRDRTVQDRILRKQSADRAVRVEEARKYQSEMKDKARDRRARLASESHSRLVAKLDDPKFRALYIAVARLIANKLAEDLTILEKLEAMSVRGSTKDAYMTTLRQVSLAGKWAPTPGGAHDRSTNIATAISVLLCRLGHIKASLPSSQQSTTGSSALEAHVLRSFYQRWILKPLRALKGCPEPLMSSSRWTEIQYYLVPSLCMKNNMTHFMRHDMDGFERYITKVEQGEKTISGATLMPHELIEKLKSLDEVRYRHNKKSSMKDVRRLLKARTQIRVVEAQWKTLISRLRDFGQLDNALAVCDVSGSMYTNYGSYYGQKNAVTPIFASLALSLIVAQLAKPPFNNGFITFSRAPQFVSLDPDRDGLLDTIRGMEKSEWTMNTDLQAVFVNLLLPLAIKNNVRQEDMIKRLFIFSDMQFDSARERSGRDCTSWETNHDAIEKAYKEAGYEMPQIVYWDLSPTFKSVPVEAERKGVALMNGFSSAMLKVFMGDAIEEHSGAVEEDRGAVEEDRGKVHKSSNVVEASSEQDDFNPINVMKAALGKKSYDGLVILD